MIEEVYAENLWSKIKLPKIKLRGFWGIFLSDLFRRVATSLIGLYIPIYIWQQTGKLSKIAFYYFLYAFCGFLFSYLGAKLIAKIGVDWSIALGSFFRFLFIIFLIFAKNNEIFFWFSGISFGICQPFDWLPYYYVISKISFLEKHFGRVAGNSLIIAKIGAALGPIVGGFIITYFSYNYLFVFAACFLVFAAAIPFLDDFEKKNMHVSFDDIIKAFKDRGIIKHIYSYGLEMFDSMAETIIWPVFLISVVGTVKSSGILQTITLLVSMGFAYFLGKFVDRKNLKMMKPGSVLHAIGWWGRYFFKSVSGLFIFNACFSIGSTMVWMPLKALLYARSTKKYTMQFWLVHEIICYGLLSIISFGFFLLLSKTSNIELMILIFGFVSLGTIFIPRLYKDYCKFLGR